MVARKDWRIYKGTGAVEARGLARRPEAPAWRQFDKLEGRRGETYRPPPGVVEAVNAALYLRRPLLVTGDPGTGKSSLAFSVARELGLGEVVSWNINSRSTLAEGLYDYDALARLRAANLQRLRQSDGKPAAKKVGSTEPDADDVGAFITLGAVGTAFMAPAGKPRVVLIDEIDKSDLDLPNDLLHVFENGKFRIPELARIAKRTPSVEVQSLDGLTINVSKGEVVCSEFPIVIITSNGERDLPPAFLRRCLRVEMPRPDAAMLSEIVARHFPEQDLAGLDELVGAFVARQRQGSVLSTDQLLNAFYLVAGARAMSDTDRAMLEGLLLQELDRR